MLKEVVSVLLLLATFQAQLTRKCAVSCHLYDGMPISLKLPLRSLQLIQPGFKLGEELFQSRDDTCLLGSRGKEDRKRP